MPLQGIPTVPSSTPSGLRGFLTAVRTRLLQLTASPFTDAEVRSLRALIGTAGDSETPTPPVSSAPVFVQSHLIHDGPGSESWTTVNAADAGVPTDAVAVILQAIWSVGAMSFTAVPVYIRPEATSPLTYLLAYILRDPDDQVTGAAQGIFPLSAAGTFDWFTQGNFSGGGFFRMEIIGYIRGQR